MRCMGCKEWYATCSPRAVRASDGALIGGPVVARCTPGVPVGPGVAPGNVVVGGAHLGSGSMGGEGGSSSVF
jgi:hypothetical protein